MKKIKYIVCLVIFASIFNFNTSIKAEAASTIFMKPAEGRYSDFFHAPRPNRLHKGLDIAASGIVPVFATAAGTVTKVVDGCPNTPGACLGFGNYVTVRHTFNGEVIDSVYAHLRPGIEVSVGQSVNKGRQLGIMGNSGASEGQHLHFEMHTGGYVNSNSAVDPLPFINGDMDSQLPTLPVEWHKGTLNVGQVGWIKIEQPINLWKRVDGELVYVRVLKENELYRVYEYDNLYGGQYNVGDNHYITKMDTHIEYRNAYMEWRGIEFNRNQVGGLDILKPINLWKKDANGKLTYERVLNAGEFYRVYGYSSDNGGQYDVGGGYWVTNMSGYITYSTPSKEFLDRAQKRIY